MSDCVKRGKISSNNGLGPVVPKEEMGSGGERFCSGRVECGI